MTANPNGEDKSQKRALLAIVIGTLLVFALVLAAVVSSTSAPGATSVDAEAYAAEVAAALADADAGLGAELIQERGCAACHIQGEGRLAPLFDGGADLAGERRPPLSAEQYLYEAILFPALHLVDGYTNAMPNNYQDRLSQREVGHMIAYLLSLTGEDNKP